MTSCGDVFSLKHWMDAERTKSVVRSAVCRHRKIFGQRCQRWSETPCQPKHEGQKIRAKSAQSRESAWFSNNIVIVIRITHLCAFERDHRNRNRPELLARRAPLSIVSATLFMTSLAH